MEEKSKRDLERNRRKRIYIYIHVCMYIERDWPRLVREKAGRKRVVNRFAKVNGKRLGVSPLVLDTKGNEWLAPRSEVALECHRSF